MKKQSLVDVKVVVNKERKSFTSGDGREFVADYLIIPLTQRGLDWMKEPSNSYYPAEIGDERPISSYGVKKFIIPYMRGAKGVLDFFKDKDVNIIIA